MFKNAWKYPLASSHGNIVVSLVFLAARSASLHSLACEQVTIPRTTLSPLSGSHVLALFNSVLQPLPSRHANNLKGRQTILLAKFNDKGMFYQTLQRSRFVFVYKVIAGFYASVVISAHLIGLQALFL